MNWFLWALLIGVCYFIVGAVLAGFFVASSMAEEEKRKPGEKKTDPILDLIMAALIFFAWPFVGAFIIGVNILGPSDKKNPEAKVEKSKKDPPDHLGNDIDTKL